MVPDRSTAFREYLNPGRPAYVDRYAAPLVGTMRVVEEAGGVSVLAHGRASTARTRSLPRRSPSLAGLGLAGLEVDHQDHRPEDRRRLREIAESLSLVVTGSSDHHGLGSTTTSSAATPRSPTSTSGCSSWQRPRAARSGRDTPR